MNILLWVLQVVLAWFCIAGGFFQMFKIEQLRKGVASMRALPRWLWALIGAVGCLAGIGLILPGAIHVQPGLTAISAAVVAGQSVLVSVVYVAYRDRAPLPYSVVMGVIAAFVAYGRFVLSPF